MYVRRLPIRGEPPHSRNGSGYTPPSPPPTPKISLLYAENDQDHLHSLYRGIHHLETNATLIIKRLPLEQFSFFSQEEILSSQVVIPLVSDHFLASPVYRNTALPLLRRIHARNVGHMVPLLFEGTHIGEEAWLDTSQVFPDQPIFFAERAPGAGKIRIEMGLIQRLAGHIVDRITDFYRSQVLPRIPPAREECLFISYSRKDFKIAGPMRMELERRGVLTWMDQHNLLPGVNWSERLDQAIRDAWGVLLVYSPAADRSKYVNYEWTYGRGHGCTLVPVMIKDVAILHPRLCLLQIVDWSNIRPEHYPYDDFLNDLMELESVQNFK